MQTVTLDNALDVVEALPLEQQETLFEIWQKRKLETGRKKLLQEIEEGKAKFKRGELKPKTVAELMKDILE